MEKERANKFLLAACLLVAGCTPDPVEYVAASNNTSGGYRDRMIARGVYEIQVTGNSEKDTANLRKYFDRRATELCNHNHFRPYGLTQDKYRYLQDTYQLFTPRIESVRPYLTGRVDCNAKR
jgi:hypothetical protein